MDFLLLASGSKPRVKASYKRSRVVLGVAVGYSGWGDRELASWELLVGIAYCNTAAKHHYSTAALQYASDEYLDSQ